MRGSSSSGEPPTLVLSANCCSNLLHFRGGLLAALQAEGFRLVALAPLDGAADELERRGVEVRPLAISRSGLNALAEARLIGHYVREFRALKPAAYCSFTIKPNVYGGIAARIAGVPAIANVTGLGTSFLSKGMLWAIAARLYRAAFRRARKVFFHNEEDCALFVGSGIVAPLQAQVIPGSGVDLDHFRPAEAQASAPPTFLFIGRLIAQKGVRAFVEAARQVRARHPDWRFQLLGAIDPGNRSSVSRRELESWVAQGLAEPLGQHADVRPFVSAATAIVLPSHREGLSRALLEAAAMGKPLVGTDVPGIRELIDEGVNGALCAVGDAASLADAMARIGTASRDELGRLGRNSRSKVEANFGEAVVIRAYLDALHPFGQAAKDG
jgi:glycosyltransferase involved in cell wall biosynthesis